MIKIVFTIFTIFMNFSNLHAFLGFQNDEKFELVSDFGKMNKNNELNLGLKVKALGNKTSIFSDNYKVLYFRNKNIENANENSILIIFDIDLNLELDIFGDFAYENKKIKFLSSNTVLDLIVRDDDYKRLINPIFVLKNNNNLSSEIDFELDTVILVSENNESFVISRTETPSLESFNYVAIFNINTPEKSGSNLKGIYYIEIFLNNESVFRKEYQSIYLNINEYKISGDKSNSNSPVLKKLELHNLKFNKGENQIKVEYGDAYLNKKIRNFKVDLNG